MNRYKPRKITKEEFVKLDENNLMFITYPGRMGDEDGSTFVIKNGNELTIYRVDGWMYPQNNEEIISLKDMAKQFPKWSLSLKHSSNEKYHGKYKFIYMGFGNGLCVDNSIYGEFEPYLNELVDKYLEEVNNDEGYKYSAIFDEWENAVIKMAKDKKIKITNKK